MGLMWFLSPLMWSTPLISPSTGLIIIQISALKILLLKSLFRVESFFLNDRRQIIMSINKILKYFSEFLAGNT